ncbi:MAG: GerMN domain-containing protein [Candidatus Coatesbacteria bacterium]|nr:MAG: GerMN domain-containing protein [Candidatus Coatesbacteria bacterium]
MAERNSQRVWKAVIATAVGLAVIALVWGALRYRSSWVTRLLPAAETPATAETGAAPATTAEIYFADAEYTKLVAERRPVAAAETPEERTRLLVAELLAGPEASTLSPTLPPRARLLSVFVRDGVAMLNFDKNLQSKRFGTTGELFALNSLYETVTANVDGVDAVFVLIEGNAYPTLAGGGGHVASGFPLYGELGRYVYGPSRESPE